MGDQSGREDDNIVTTVLVGLGEGDPFVPVQVNVGVVVLVISQGCIQEHDLGIQMGERRRPEDGLLGDAIPVAVS